MPEQFVDVIQPHVSRTIWAIVELLRYSGMRPTEGFIMRGHRSTTGPTWLYRPSTTRPSTGRERVVALGPRCQDILKPFLTLNTNAFLFSPQTAMDERRKELRARRKTKVQPSQQARTGTQTASGPGVHRYTRWSWEGDRPRVRAGRPAARKTAEKTKAGWLDARSRWTCRTRCHRPERLIPRWGPNRLRHSFATLARREFGIEGAGATLGHSKLSVTELYAEKDLALAHRVAAAIG